jgi:hypothetical protein
VVLRHALTSDLPLTPSVLACDVSARGADRLTRAKQLFVQGYARLMLARRLLLLAAVLMLLTALGAGLAPREQAAQPPPAQTASSQPAGGTVDKQIPAAEGSDTQVVVRRGEVLRLEVSGDVLDSVLIERLDRMEAIAPLTPARFDILADAPAGLYPIRLVDADRRIGSIQITE